MKMRLKMKYESHRRNIDFVAKTWTQNPKCKMCLSMMMVVCNRQHLSNPCS